MADVNTVNEASDAEIIVRSYNTDGELSSIIAMEYRIDDVKSNTEVRDWTEVASPASETTIALTPSDTEIIDNRNASERRLLTTRTTYTGDKIHNAEYVYVVRALKGVT